MKAAIIGAGNVGSSIAYALLIKGRVSDIALIDINEEKARGEALDLSHGGSFVQASEIEQTGFSGCRDADIIVITAGQNRKPDETRLDLIRKNAGIYDQIIPKILEYNDDPLLIIVSNPVDVLTYYTLQITGLNPDRVIGSGTVLDSSRFRYSLSKDYGIDPRNVHAYIIGEHGASAVPVWSRTNIAGMPILEYCHICAGPCREDHRERIFREVVDAGKEVIQRKGATFYAVALAVERIIAAVVRDENSVLTVSRIVEDYYGISQVCFSLPYIINRKGIVRPLHLTLNDMETEQLRKSAEVLQNYNSKLQYS
ncbi:MAG: L-lactate dehydrogenase [Calditrichia bacterium]